LLRKEEPDLSPESPVKWLSEETRGYPLIYTRGQTMLVALNPGAKKRTCRIPITGKIVEILQHGCSLKTAGNHTEIHLNGKSWGLFRIDIVSPASGSA
jgi:hypothetical protein